MSTYFETHAQRRTQWGRVRRGGHTDSGVVVVHTYEAPAGRTWQAGARYLTTRTTPGSYHWLADALGSTGHLAPWSAETWHCRFTNPWSVGLSMMTYAADWPRLTRTQRDNLVRGTALGAARYSAWRVSTGRAPIPARRITRAQAMNRVPGFIGHGETDPGRRTDPGAGFPWADFLDHYRDLTTPTAQEPVMSVDNVRIGIHGLLSEAAARSTPTGRQISDYLREVLVPAVWAAQIGTGDTRRSMATALARAEANAAAARAGTEALAEAIASVPGVDPDELARKVAAAVNRADVDLAGTYTVTVTPQED